ncbi:MAG: elongation factor P, partial [Phycisphaerae bacterium]|nr:elongation factor P [Phycisphaerae bacterium]
LFRVSDLMHVTPGKGRGMVQAKFYSLKSNSYYDRRLRSDEPMEVVHLDYKSMEYLYEADG